MYYMCADNDLEFAQMQDLEEMLASKGSDRVNVIALSDRHEEAEHPFSGAGAGGLENWTSAKLLQVKHERLVELGDWGEVNTADGKTLARFIAEAASRFPAKRYALILANHGAGWPGGFVDETSDEWDDMLTLAEIREALRSTRRHYKRMEIIGFDACLMANIETAHALAPYTKFLVASQELEPWEGWFYTTILDALSQKPTMGGREIGKTIVDTYFDFFSSGESLAMSKESMATLSVVESAYVFAAARALNDVGAAAAAELTNDRPKWIEIAAARKVTEEYGVSPMDDSVAAFDAISFVQNLGRRTLSLSVRAAAAAAEKSLRACVAYTRSGEARPGANGISVYYPKDPTALEPNGEDGYDSLTFNRDARWLSMLERVVSEAEEDEMPPFVGTVRLSESVVTGDNTIKISADMKGDDIAESWLVLAQRIPSTSRYLVIGRVPADYGDAESVTIDWDGKWFLLSDEENFYVCPTVQTTRTAGGVLFYLSGQVKRKNTAEWIDATLVFFLAAESAQDARFIYAIQRSRYGVVEVHTQAGDAIRPTYLMVDESGDLELVFAEDGPSLILGERLRITYGDVPDGDYLIGIVARDYADNTSESFGSVTIRRTAPIRN